MINSDSRNWSFCIYVYEHMINMMPSLFCGIIIGLLINIDVKKLNIDIYWSFHTQYISSDLVNNISPRIMPIQCTVRQYSRKQLLDYRFMPRRILIPNEDTLSVLKK